MVFGTLLASLSQVGKEHDTGGVEFWREPMRAGWLMKQGDVIARGAAAGSSSRMVNSSGF